MAIDLQKYKLPETQRKIDLAKYGVKDTQSTEIDTISTAEKIRSGVVGFGIGVAKEVGSTVKGLGTLGTTISQQTSGRVVEALTGVPKEEQGSPLFIKGTPEEKELSEKLEATTPSQKAGKFVAQLGEFFVPATKIAKATKGLSFIPKLSLRTAGDVAVTTAQRGDIEKATETGAISAGLQTLSPILGGASRILKSFTKGTAGVLSGRGSDVIEQILKTPDDALVGLKQDVVQGVKNDANSVREFLAFTRKNATEEYGKALESLPLPKKPITMKGIKDTYTSLLKKNGVKVDRKAKDALDFFETRLSSPEEKILRQVFTDINKWSNTTPKGIDTLAQKINAYKKPGETSPQLNGILGDLSKATRDYLSKRVDGAKEMVETFVDQKRFLSELETNFGKVGNIDDPKQIKATLSKLQTIFNKNKDVSRELLESIPDGKAILGRQAGRELSTQIPRTTGAIGGLIQGVAQATISPKFIGELAVYTGKTTEALQPIVSILETLQPQARVAILQTFLSATNE